MFRIMRRLWPRRLWAKCIVSLLLLVGLAIASAAGYCAFIMLQGKWELQKVIAEIEAEDPDWAIDAVDQRRQMPTDDDDNLKRLEELELDRNYQLTEALDNWNSLAAYKMPHEKNVRIPVVVRVTYDAQMPEWQDTVKSLQNILTTNGDGSPLPDRRRVIIPSKQLSAARRLVYHDSIYRLNRNDHVGFTNDILVLLHLSRMSKSFVHSDGHYLAESAHAASTLALERMLGLSELPEQQLERLQQAYMPFCKFPDFASSLRDARVYEHYMFLRGGYISLYADFWSDLSLCDQALVPVVKDANHARILRNYNNAIDQFSKANDPVSAFKEIEMLDHAARMSLRNRGLFLSTHISISVPVGYSLVLMTKTRVLVAAIACERFRIKEGRWPESLAELPKEIVAELPIDPFTGEPLKYKRLEDGIVIYSVGTNMNDDGGHISTTMANNFRKSPTDVGVRLWDPEFRNIEPKGLDDDDEP